MLIAALALLGFGVLFHGAAFVLESLLWGRPVTRRLFGVRGDDAVAATRLLAVNQGIYNLVLAAITTTGLVLLIGDASSIVGATLALAGGAAMTVAGLTLLVIARRAWQAALVQAAPPGLGCALLITSLATAGV
jgi:putative membrane protein